MNGASIYKNDLGIVSDMGKGNTRVHLFQRPSILLCYPENSIIPPVGKIGDTCLGRIYRKAGYDLEELDRLRNALDQDRSFEQIRLGCGQETYHPNWIYAPWY